MMSVNQTAAQIKLLEMWKAKNTEDYPLKIEFQTTAREGREQIQEEIQLERQ